MKAPEKQNKPLKCLRKLERRAPSNLAEEQKVAWSYPSDDEGSRDLADNYRYRRQRLTGDGYLLEKVHMRLYSMYPSSEDASKWNPWNVG